MKRRVPRRALLLIGQTDKTVKILCNFADIYGGEFKYKKPEALPGEGLPAFIRPGNIETSNFTRKLNADLLFNVHNYPAKAQSGYG